MARTGYIVYACDNETVLHAEREQKFANDVYKHLHDKVYIEQAGATAHSGQ